MRFSAKRILALLLAIAAAGGFFIYNVFAGSVLAAAPRGVSSSIMLNGVQVLVFEGKSRPEIALEIERLASTGVNTIIMRVFHNEGDRPHYFAATEAVSGVYFKTSHAPVVADALSVVLDEAHKRGVKVFAWMTTRYADYGIEGRDDITCKSFDTRLNVFARCKGLDLFNEEAVEHLENLYTDLASYPIDGVLFQDDLVLKYNEGYGRSSESSFKTEFGRPLTPWSMYVTDINGGNVEYTGEFWSWASWKNRRLLSVASRLKAAVREKNPGAKFAINLMYEAVTNPRGALAWFSQDLDAAIREGFDYYSIMAYHVQMATELEKDKREISRMIEDMVRVASAKVKDSRSVLIKFQTVDWDTGKPVPEKELKALIKAARRQASVSIALVPYRSGLPFGELAGNAALGK
ncbi:MAG: poly-beta-1,6-N-acetyl-D-glucosamine N-deacetylase PgaB [Deltaproteobacteria bacterium]|nr:poly-beta-1,6-N-acetyl-D-glucosamine N-deacetylase PgaB [Deltaproteobacteria bacterium]